MNVRSLVLASLAGGLLQSAICQPNLKSGISRSGPAVPAIFYRVAVAMDHLKFAGTRTVEVMHGPDRISHVEYVVHQGLDSRVWFPSGSQFEGQVIVETAKERLHYYPKRNIIEQLPPKREDAFLRLRQWIQHPVPAIHLTTGPGESVAGRQTEIGVVSDNKGNVRQRLWIDSANGMILKREVLDAVGDRTAYFEYSQIDYNPVVLATDFQINVRGARVVTLADKLRNLATQNQLLNVSLLPSTGFRLSGVNMVKVMGLSVLHQTYDGGRGQLSLFEVSGNTSLEGLRPSQRGIQLFGWQMGGRSFALVGNYPLPELQELSQVLGKQPI